MRAPVTISILLSLCVLFPSCDQRDPQAEFEALRDAVYSNPRTGYDVAQEYIDHFYSRKGKDKWVDDVCEIRDQYELMDDLFSNSFRSYADFITQAGEISSELTYSNYQGVRTTWKNLYSRERERLLAPLMEQVTEDSFDSFFKGQVWTICNDRYQTWDVESVDRVSLFTPVLAPDGTYKECSGVYRVHVRGNIFGFRTATPKVSISGRMGVTDSGQWDARITGYEFSEEPLF